MSVLKSKCFPFYDGGMAVDFSQVSILIYNNDLISGDCVLAAKTQ
jgi:hypothetical protein